MNADIIKLGLDDVLQSPLVKGLYVQWLARQVEYDVIDRYWQGDHPLQFATEKFTNAFGRLFRAMADNYCPIVCNALADYMQLKALTSSNKAYNKTLADFWEQSRLDFNSGLIQTSAIRYGDGYGIVQKNSKGKLRLYKQNSRTIRVMYDDEEPDMITLAVKCWKRVDGFWRLNVYVPGRLFRFVTKNKQEGAAPPENLNAFVHASDGDGPDQPADNNVIPIFHFPNDPGNDGSGVSALNDITSQQDKLNKLECDMLVASEYQAFKQRWATGIEVELDDNGNPITPTVAAIDRLMFSGNEEAKFGEFAQLDLKPHLEAAESARYEIARLSSIPLHHLGMLSGGWPSGEAMKTADVPLEAKKRDRQICWGNQWEAVACYILGIDPGELTGDEVKAEWEDVSPRDDLNEAQADQFKAQAATTRKALGVSQKQVLTELGYSDAEIEQFAADNANDQAVMQGKLMDYFSNMGPGGSGGGNAIPITGSGGGSGGGSGTAPLALPKLPAPQKA